MVTTHVFIAVSLDGYIARQDGDIVITTVPVLLGSGKPLFGVLPHDIDLTLLSSRSFPSGLVQSHYRLTA
ncbi:hypothetical protein C0P21_004618 [Escherichia coli]|nr:hypothetical protein [Escherichia coli]EFB4494881.1 hypothetical protein [Escherichia coli]HAL9156224.1 hypothetical protein [Escherichia coli]HAL9223941.1 hypothetical protein [Escherichia coli]HAL9877357.1 hypothetical protein [Escherichia coli]